MSKTFSIPKDYYITGHNLFQKSKITFEPGFTTLIGCNGSGKTTILRWIEEKLTKNNITFVSFDNLKDGGENARSIAGFQENFNLLTDLLIGSEGENIYINMSNIAQKIGNTVRYCTDTNQEELWILLDGIDSGLSIDNIIQFKKLFQCIINDTKKNNIDTYILASANEYELTRNSMTFDVTNCKYINLSSYDDYYNFILQSSKKKEERFK